MTTYTLEELVEIQDCLLELMAQAEDMPESFALNSLIEKTGTMIKEAGEQTRTMIKEAGEQIRNGK